ncbi:MAG: hypothetical protein Q8730_02615, partial [Sweet potato little leaf phytoplasma]|nr:hypothetical protein [Sweet potato little leaf phytoplasma]
MFSEGKEGPRGRINRIFLPKGYKADGWWQMMEVIHEVFGVKLVPLEWATKKNDLVEKRLVIHHNIMPSKVRCPGCSMELGVQLEPMECISFAKALKQAERATNRVEERRFEPIAGPEFFQIQKGISQEGAKCSHFGCSGNNNVVVVLTGIRW